MEDVLALKSYNPLAVEKGLRADGARAIRAGEHWHIQKMFAIFASALAFSFSSSGQLLANLMETIDESVM